MDLIVIVCLGVFVQVNFFDAQEMKQIVWCLISQFDCCCFFPKSEQHIRSDQIWIN